MSSDSLKLFGGVSAAARQVLDLRQQQHALIATNLANANTPEFRARQLDFQDVLQEVVREAEAGNVHAGDRVPLLELEPVPWALDGNSVDAEHEAAKMVENKMVYEALVVGVSHHLKLLEFAASNGGS